VKRILVEARALRQRVEAEEGSSKAWVHGIVFPRMRLDPARAAGSEAELAIP
jgi:hypothetical protein